MKNITMYLKRSCGDLVQRPNSKKMEAVDFYHGYASSWMFPNAVSYFYLQRADYSWNDDYLSVEDKDAIARGLKIDWHKYKDAIDLMKSAYDKKWKDFIHMHKTVFDKYKVRGCAIMKGTHFYEGRSNGFVAIESLDEENAFIKDMISIGVYVKCM